MGSKKRIAKYLLPILQEARGGRWWVEPFVGGANMIDKIGGRRLGYDINPYLIALLRDARDGWIPPTEVSREVYRDVKNNITKYNPAFVGFIGFCCSFGGKWFGGYVQGRDGRNRAAETSLNLVKQAPSLKGVVFNYADYTRAIIPTKSLIYCDPPYENTTSYKTPVFNYEIFWDWCREKALEGHKVFVSGYCAPNDFAALIKLPITITLNKNKKETRTEKLFTLS